MPYTALPDRRMPYDGDGTVVYVGSLTEGAVTQLSNAILLEMQDRDIAVATSRVMNGQHVTFYFFPEQREVTAYFALDYSDQPTGDDITALSVITGSNDTTNGLDGTWETASLPSGTPAYVDDHSWRSGIKPISFTGPKKNVRLQAAQSNTNDAAGPRIHHVYGRAAGGQMAHDLVFIDHDTTPGVEYTAPEDFGDQPLGTTVVRQFRVKNTSASRTATNVNIQCNDADFAISEDGVIWVTTIDLASLAAGAESPTYHVRCTTPAPGAPLLPRFARIIVGCDAGFFG